MKVLKLLPLFLGLLLPMSAACSNTPAAEPNEASPTISVTSPPQPTATLPPAIVQESGESEAQETAVTESGETEIMPTISEPWSADDFGYGIQVHGNATVGDPAGGLLQLAESVMENWLEARNEVPTQAAREGFRLLALHRQGAKGDPSFNACRETAREVAYHANLLRTEPDHTDTARRITMMVMLVRHLHLFVSGKMQVAELGEFCCSSSTLRSLDAEASDDTIQQRVA